MGGHEPVKQAPDQIPQKDAVVERIVELLKKGSGITGYQLSYNTVVEK